MDPELRMELRRVNAKLDLLLAESQIIYHEERLLMTDLSQLDAAVDTLTENEHEAVEELGALAEEVKSLQAGTISQEQVDAIQARVTDVATKLAEASTTARNETAPPAA